MNRGMCVTWLGPLHADCRGLADSPALSGRVTSLLSLEMVDPQKRRRGWGHWSWRPSNSQTLIFKKLRCCPISIKTFFLYQSQTCRRDSLVKQLPGQFACSWSGLLEGHREATFAISPKRLQSIACHPRVSETMWFEQFLVTLVLFGTTLNQNWVSKPNLPLLRSDYTEWPRWKVVWF